MSDERLLNIVKKYMIQGMTIGDKYTIREKYGASIDEIEWAMDEINRTA